MHQALGNALWALLMVIFNAVILLFRQFGGWLIGLVVVNWLTGAAKSPRRRASRRGYSRSRRFRRGRRR